ncbi:MAG: hypothetical protein IT424_15640, partial [Pirellulales bacterium]|nr:hypothetical protein [Pirellulales bacterium]
MRRLRLRILSRLRAIVRWRYILPRAIVVVAMVLAVRFGLDPLLRWTIVTVGEASLGAKVEVGGLRTSLWGGRLVVASVAAANPRKPMRNLAEAADIRLQVDMKQLLRKRLVVHAGTIRGLAFDSPRATSGALPDAPAEAAGPSALDPVIRAAEEKALGWLDGISGRLQQDLMEALATPKLVDELETRWPEE